MDSLLIALAWLAALVLACVKLIETVGGDFTSWCGWLAVVLIAALGCIGAFMAYRTNPRQP